MERIKIENKLESTTYDNKHKSILIHVRNKNVYTEVDDKRSLPIAIWSNALGRVGRGGGACSTVEAREGSCTDERGFEDDEVDGCAFNDVTVDVVIARSDSLIVRNCWWSFKARRSCCSVSVIWDLIPSAMCSCVTIVLISCGRFIDENFFASNSVSSSTVSSFWSKERIEIY